MGESSLWLALVFILGTGAIGVYLLLPTDHPFTASAVKWFGAPLAVISLVLMASLLGVPVEWWPKLPDARHIPRVLFAIPAFGSVAAAALAVTSRDVQRCLFWFGGLLLSNSVLLLLHGAYLLAMAVVTVFAVGAAACWSLGVLPFASPRPRNVASPANSHEPFLACLTGFLFAVVLIGTIASATSGIGVSDVERLGGLMGRKGEAIVAARSQASDPDWISRDRTHFGGLVRAVVREHFVAASAGAFLILIALLAGPLIGRERVAQPNERSGVAPPET